MDSKGATGSGKGKAGAVSPSQLIVMEDTPFTLDFADVDAFLKEAGTVLNSTTKVMGSDYSMNVPAIIKLVIGELEMSREDVIIASGHHLARCGSKEEVRAMQDAFTTAGMDGELAKAICNALRKRILVPSGNMVKGFGADWKKATAGARGAGPKVTMRRFLLAAAVSNGMALYFLNDRPVLVDLPSGTTGEVASKTLISLFVACWHGGITSDNHGNFRTFQDLTFVLKNVSTGGRQASLIQLYASIVNTIVKKEAIITFAAHGAPPEKRALAFDYVKKKEAAAPAKAVAGTVKKTDKAAKPDLEFELESGSDTE
jgi:hypothetical protein